LIVAADRPLVDGFHPGIDLLLRFIFRIALALLPPAGEFGLQLDKSGQLRGVNAAATPRKVRTALS